MKPLVKNAVIVILLFGTAIYLPSCMKEATLPVLTTTAISAIAATHAAIGGIVTSDGGAEVTETGVCWDTSENPTTEDNKTSDSFGKGYFYSSLIQLAPNTKYYVRAYASNSAGTGYGNQVTFTTNQIGVATLTTTAITEITGTSAFSGGNIIDDVEGTLTAWGVCWGTTAGPTTNNIKTTETEYEGSKNYISYINGLEPSTKYYVRAYATNSAGTAYGNELNFTTSVSIIILNPDLTNSSVSDLDGNIYKTIQIGTQLWMAENLKTTKFNDGVRIPNVTDNIEWESLLTPGYCWFNNDEATYKSTYGALYNWYAVKTDKLCPTGWHAPSNDEWNALITNLGGEIAAGVKVIETGNTHWLRTIPGATNESGFTGLPGGSRSISEDFRGFMFLGNFGHWWTTTDYTPPYDALIAQLPSMYDSNGQLDFEAGFAAKKIGGASVRCVKN